MNIGKAAERANLSAKTIRFYEDIGLIQPERLPNGYREYSDRDVHDLRFVGRARGLGFSVEECRHLLELYRDKGRASSEVRTAAVAHISVIRTKIKELRSMETTLASLIDQCAGDSRPDCPILEELAVGRSAS